MPAEDRAISDFPIALQLLNTALVLISNPDGQGGYDSYQATLTEIGRVVLETQYTQDLGNVDVFTAIKNCRVLSGTTTPTSSEGADGQLYVKYSTSDNDTSVVGLYVKLSGAWAEIATGDVGIECTQAQYDAWEQAGTLLQDTNYYITDGQSGGGVTIDDTTASASTVYSSLKTQGVFDSHDGDFADEYDATTAYSTGDLCIYNNVLYKAKQATTGNLPTNTTYWEQTSIADELNGLNTGKQDALTVEDISSGITFTNLTNMTSVTVLGAKKYGRIVDLWLQPVFTRSTAGVNYGCTVNFTNNNNRPLLIATTSAFQGSESWCSNFQNDGWLFLRELKGGSGEYSPYLRFIYICNA